MSRIPFWKMSGAGNDFILMDYREVPWRQWDLSQVAKTLCPRRTSVGADGFILLIPPQDPAHHFAWRFFNADGSEAEMCGNGARCAARFAHLKGLAPCEMRFETLSGVLEAWVQGEEVRIRMGDPTEIREAVSVSLDSGKVLSVVFLNTGVPHAVQFVEDVEDVDVVGLGRRIRHHEVFQPAGTNADFVQIVDRSTLKMRTYERGVEDETLACGTGAVACAVAGHRVHGMEAPISVITRSGRVLKIHFQEKEGRYQEVFLAGEARLIYEGLLSPDILGE